MRVLLCGSFVVSLSVVATAATAHVPSDFQLHARFFPGAGSEKRTEPWRLTISADGSAAYEIYVYSEWHKQTYVKRTQLSQRDMDEIIAALQKADFFALPRRIADPAFSDSGHTRGIELKITADRKTHFVLFAIPGTLPDRAAAKRLWSAWSVISRKAPSPNHNQEFSWWLHNNPL
jgi:hypothetical protein